MKSLGIVDFIKVFGSSTWARTRDLRINRKQFLQTMLVLCGLQAIKLWCAINCVIAYSLMF